MQEATGLANHEASMKLSYSTAWEGEAALRSEKPSVYSIKFTELDVYVQLALE